MIQINNGFKEYYYLLEDGTIYNINTDRILNPNKDHIFILNTLDNKRRKIALKTLYKIIYNKNYCIDNIDNLQNEEWKQIEDTNGMYQVSNMGRVKSMNGYQTVILKPFHNQRGYERVDIVINGERKTKLIHRIVAAAFLPLPQKLDMKLHHIDFNKDNNKAQNLEWLTAADHVKKHKERILKDVSTKSENDNDRESI